MAEIVKTNMLQAIFVTDQPEMWNTDENGEWAERVKGVDDYLVSLQKADRKEYWVENSVQKDVAPEWI